MKGRIDLVRVGLSPCPPGADILGVHLPGHHRESLPHHGTEGADLTGKPPRPNLGGKRLGTMCLDQPLPSPLQRLLVSAATLLRPALLSEPSLLIKLGPLLDLGQHVRELVLQPPPLTIRPAVPASVQVVIRGVGAAPARPRGCSRGPGSLSRSSARRRRAPPWTGRGV